MNADVKLKFEECSVILNSITASRLNSFLEYLSKEKHTQYELKDIVYLFLTYEIKSDIQGSDYLKEYFSERERKEIDVEILSSLVCMSDNLKYV